MNNETLNINKENVQNAYGTATDEQKALLEIIFGFILGWELKK